MDNTYDSIWQAIAVHHSELCKVSRGIVTDRDAIWEALDNSINHNSLLENENAELKTRIHNLENENAELKTRIHNLECADVELHILVAELRDDIGIPR